MAAAHDRIFVISEKQECSEKTIQVLKSQLKVLESKKEDPQQTAPPDQKKVSKKLHQSMVDIQA